MSDLLTREEYESIAKDTSYPSNSWINGKYTGARSGETYESFNPATGEKLCDIAACGKEDVDYAVKKARQAFEIERLDLRRREGTPHYTRMRDGPHAAPRGEASASGWRRSVPRECPRPPPPSRYRSALERVAARVAQLEKAPTTSAGTPSSQRRSRRNNRDRHSPRSRVPALLGRRLPEGP